LCAGAAWGPRRAWGAARKILIVGDSMIAGAIGIHLQRRLKKEYGLDVRRHGKSSSGLSRPDFYDWMEVGTELREEFAPDAVVVMFGGNDAQGLYMGRKADPKWIRYPDREPWDEEYRRRVDAFAEAMGAGGAKIFWIGMPVMKPTRLHERMQHLNGIYRAQMKARPNAEFIDIWASLAGPDGEYVDRLEVGGQRERVRAHDGVHVAGPGAALLTDQIAPLIVSWAGIPVAAQMGARTAE
jgi:hypothetical protein